VAERGDLLTLKRRLGFGSRHDVVRFLVVQADLLNDVLDTVLAIPLDEAFSYYSDYPGAVPVRAAEARTQRDQVAVVTALGSVDLSRFEPVRAARVGTRTLARIDRMLETVLGLDRETGLGGSALTRTQPEPKRGILSRRAAISHQPSAVSPEAISGQHQAPSSATA
jgi:mRNA-degrading endonuclease toxin of MazEF toxin-antitoxin module